jgi:hypothetical protein
MTEDEIEKVAQDLIFEAASESGFFLSLDENDEPIYSVGEHGEVDVTDELNEFAFQLIKSLILLKSRHDNTH